MEVTWVDPLPVHLMNDGPLIYYDDRVTHTLYVNTNLIPPSNNLSLRPLEVRINGHLQAEEEQRRYNKSIEKWNQECQERAQKAIDNICNRKKSY